MIVIPTVGGNSSALAVILDLEISSHPMIVNIVQICIVFLSSNCIRYVVPHIPLPV